MIDNINTIQEIENVNEAKNLNHNEKTKKIKKIIVGIIMLFFH
jgi:hypothetical protein